MRRSRRACDVDVDRSPGRRLGRARRKTPVAHERSMLCRSITATTMADATLVRQKCHFQRFSEIVRKALEARTLATLACHHDSRRAQPVPRAKPLSDPTVVVPVPRVPSRLRSDRFFGKPSASTLSGVPTEVACERTMRRRRFTWDESTEDRPEDATALNPLNPQPRDGLAHHPVRRAAAIFGAGSTWARRRSNPCGSRRPSTPTPRGLRGGRRGT